MNPKKDTQITLRTNELSNGTIMIEKITITNAPWNPYYQTVFPRIEVTADKFDLYDSRGSYRTYKPFEIITTEQLKDIKNLLKRAVKAANDLVVKEVEYIF